jgi:AraC family transcriptional activator of pobA
MDEAARGLHNSNIMTRTNPESPALPVRRQLPNYALYGEADRSLDFGWLHCESVAERSGLYDWEIQPHRHDALFQILHIRQGHVKLTSEGQRRELLGPCVVTVPALVAHGFNFSAGTEGTVLTVQAQHLHHLLRGEPALADLWRQLHHSTLGPHAATDVHEAMAALLREQAGTARWRTLGVDLALQRLLLVLGRHLADAAEPAQAASHRALAHVRRFQAVVDAGFRQPLSVTDAAAQLGITATQLNRVCQQVLGNSALAVIQQRIVLEAQRELAYTQLSIKQIGLGLGFADAPYFTRFFVRHTAQTPSDWRAKQQAAV